jgi:NAD-reducing hydrogenase large subunit
MGLINEDESVEFTDGALRLIDAKVRLWPTALRQINSPRLSARPWSPLLALRSSPTTSRSGIPRGSYRGRLVRLNIAKSMGTPLADKELAEFKQLADGPVQSSFFYHHARLIDILHGIEKIEMILTDPLILDKHVRATAGVNRRGRS